MRRLGWWLALGALLLAANLAQAEDQLPRRGFLGAQIQPVTDSIRAARGSTFEGGLLVAKVFPEGSAAKAGIREGDIILAVAGSPVQNSRGFFQIFNRYKGGSSVELGLLRGKKRITKTVALVPFPKEQPADYELLYESVAVNDSLRRMIISKPHGEGPFPVVLMVGGIGCYSLDVPPGSMLDPYITILGELTKNGFATVRVEKSGMGDSQGPPCAEVDFRTELAGYTSALRAMNRYPFMDTTNVVLFGHSMGGVLAPLVWHEYPVKGIIAMATMGKDWIEYELINQRRQLVLEGVDYDSVQVAARQRELASHLLFVEKQTPEEILKAHPDLADYLQYPAHYTYMQQLADLNMAREWKDVDAQVLVVYGSADFLTSADEHEYLAAMINHYHPGRAKYIEIPGMDHYFTKIASQQESFQNLQQGFANKEFNTAVVPVIVDFCKSVVTGS